MTTPTSHTCVRCKRPYIPELQDFHLCCICERDLIATRTLGPNWTEKLIPLLDLMSPNTFRAAAAPTTLSQEVIADATAELLQEAA